MENLGTRLTADIMSLSIAPVFLISAVAVILTCMAQRYGRVIDRIRQLLREGDKIHGNPVRADHVRKEVRALYARARLLRITVILSVACIVFVVIAILLLYVDMMFGLTIPRAPELSFAVALIVLLLSLALFIEDFAISLRSIKHDIRSTSHADIVESKPATS